MLSQEHMATSKPFFAYHFALANLATSQTATVVPTVGAVTNGYIMPLAGCIVGYAITKSAAHGAGSLDFDLALDGTSTLTIAADTTSTYATIEYGNEPFSAGQVLTVTYTSDGSLAATTVDVTVTVFVVLNEFNV